MAIFLTEQEAKKMFGLKTTKTNKYNAQKTTIDGITFASKKEAQYYAELVILKKAGLIKDFTMQQEFIL